MDLEDLEVYLDQEGLITITVPPTRPPLIGSSVL